MIHVGDKVKIAMIDRAYTSYPGFLDYYREVGGSSTVERVCSQYEYGREPTGEEARNNVFTVMFIREHGGLDNRNLAVINDGNKTFIIDVEGLTLVSSDLPFAEGDKVFIKDTGPVYSLWDTLIKNMATTMIDGEEVYRKWTDDRSPSSDELGGKSPEAIFTIKWIGHHVTRPEEDIVAIVSNNTHTYVIGTRGLERVGENSWDKYIIYVRNWAVINKNSAQSVRDATGPKSYAEWLSGRK